MLFIYLLIFVCLNGALIVFLLLFLKKSNFWYVFWCFIVYKPTGPPNCTGLANTFAQKITGHANRNVQIKKNKQIP